MDVPRKLVLKITATIEVLDADNVENTNTVHPLGSELNDRIGSGSAAVVLQESAEEAGAANERNEPQTKMCEQNTVGKYEALDEAWLASVSGRSGRGGLPGVVDAAGRDSFSAVTGQLYQLNRNARAPREGSMNSTVWELIKRLPATFSRQQFESVVPAAMKYDFGTQKFGIETSFNSIRRARQAYFSEFKKRDWIIPVL
jgi:hypothetical protein